MLDLDPTCVLAQGVAPGMGRPLGPGRRLNSLVAACVAPAIGPSGGSVLTPDGSPLEIGHATGSVAPRYTLEAVDPATPVTERLAAVRKVAAQQGFDLPQGTRSAWLAGLQAKAPTDLEFGAWLGLRLRGSDVASKLYVELPRSMDPAALQIVGHPAWTGLSPRLAGLSLAPCRGEILELYFGGAPATRGGLTALFFEAGLRRPCGASELFELLHEVHPGAASQRLACHDVGVSFAHAPDGALMAVSVLLYADQVFGGGLQIRERIARLFRLLGADPSSYLADTHPGGRAPQPGRHSILSLTVPVDGPISAHIGLSADPQTLIPKNVQKERLIP